jgi:hypothetical protein
MDLAVIVQHIARHSSEATERPVMIADILVEIRTECNPNTSFAVTIYLAHVPVLVVSHLQAPFRRNN